MKTKNIVYVIIALVVIWVIASFMQGPLENEDEALLQRGESEVDLDTRENSEDVETDMGSADELPLTNKGTKTAIVTTDNELEVLDQPYGNLVTLKRVATMQNSWVVLYEERTGGRLGNILGAQRFDEGIYTGGQIELLRPMVSGRTYHVLIHADNGDKMFDHKSDVPVANGPRATFQAL